MEKCKSFYIHHHTCHLLMLIDRYVWWARKPVDTNSSSDEHGDPIRDDESLEPDEEDNGQHATEPAAQVTDVPRPVAADVTQVSVEQLEHLAVSDEKGEDKKAEDTKK
jgi:hypothetical protein